MKYRKAKEEELRVLHECMYLAVRDGSHPRYSEEELRAWCPDEYSLSEWAASFSGHDVIVAEDDGGIVGFVDGDGKHYVDRLYVIPLYQGLGVGKKLLGEIERKLSLPYEADVSYTAAEFFKKEGYEEIGAEEVVRNGIRIGRLKMAKKG